MPLDHFLCYAAKAVPSTPLPVPFADAAGAVEITNSYYPGGAFASLNGVVRHCNPATKYVVTSSGTTSYPAMEPASHLVCWQARPNPQSSSVPRAYIVTNQFGQGTVTLGAMQTLCLPSFKDENNPANLPAGPDAQPSDLNHFTCFAPTTTSAWKAPGVIKVSDQFVPPAVGPVTVRIGKPASICLPTQKTVDPTKPAGPLVDNGAQNSELCFNISLVSKAAIPLPKVVYAENQFGEGAVDVVHATQLCLPSVADPGPAGA